jgi:hypothetical protein
MILVAHTAVWRDRATTRYLVPLSLLRRYGVPGGSVSLCGGRIGRKRKARLHLFLVAKHFFQQSHNF